MTFESSPSNRFGTPLVPGIFSGAGVSAEAADQKLARPIRAASFSALLSRPGGPASGTNPIAVGGRRQALDFTPAVVKTTPGSSAQAASGGFETGRGRGSPRQQRQQQQQQQQQQRGGAARGAALVRRALRGPRLYSAGRRAGRAKKKKGRPREYLKTPGSLLPPVVAALPRSSGRRANPTTK
ncbi:AF4/FMR2 family member lilli-like [Schistocerca gregaria]|uniref:AF4/FMR2 family member lilli-like n=1 Tax=Schistocerca gregaria TaxID=7010 RepID=UPI00211E0FA0|nr:AF4/FMR2 family member lilli-like [Schistocerca gregaria]